MGMTKRILAPGLSALLSLRGALLGEGAALSSGRFLYETVGELLLLRWASKGGRGPESLVD